MTGGVSALSLNLLVPFGAVLLSSVLIVIVAARRTRSVADYFVAGNRITAAQNALALTGDFVGVGGLFAITGLIGVFGADGYVLAIGAICGFPLMLFLFAEPLRRLGQYTFADVMTSTLGNEEVRLLAATTQLILVLVQLTAQMVGAISLLRLLFGLPDTAALTLIGLAVVIYVLVGGMVATTWLQIVKASLMIVVAAIIALMAVARFGFNPLGLLRHVVDSRGVAAIVPGRLFVSPADTLSILLGLALGNASMPHVLMRLNTVTNPIAARRSVFMGIGLIVLFHLVVLILGFAAMVIVGATAIRHADPGGNMALPLLAKAVGGDMMLGSVSAIALATILAVMTGLVMAGSAALTQDLWVSVFRHGSSSDREQLLVGRVATVVLVGVALGMTTLCRGQNIGFLSALGYSVAASANFPALLLVLHWKRRTTSGVMAGMATGLVSSLVLILLSPLVQVGILHHAAAIFPLQNPAVVSIPLALAVGVVVSLVTKRSRVHSPV